MIVYNTYQKKKHDHGSERYYDTIYIYIDSNIFLMHGFRGLMLLGYGYDCKNTPVIM
jgi:hypothetical protein